MTVPRRPIVVVTAFVALSATALTMPAPPVAGAGASDDAGRATTAQLFCPDFVLVSVPGAGTRHGPGRALGRLATALDTALRVDDGLDRLAVRVVHWDSAAPTAARLREVRRHGLDASYFDGRGAAVRETKRLLRGYDRRCVRPAVIVAGYSQGATVARQALAALADDNRFVRHLAGLVLVGDPMAAPGTRVHRAGRGVPRGLVEPGSLPRNLLLGRSITSWCRTGDAVCGGGRIGGNAVARHLSYGVGRLGQAMVASYVDERVGWIRDDLPFSYSGRVGDPMRLALPVPSGAIWWSIYLGRLSGLNFSDGVFSGTPTRAFRGTPGLRARSPYLARGVVTQFGVAFDVYPRTTAKFPTYLASVGADGGPGNGWSVLGDLSGDGNNVVLTSAATNLVAGDTNGVADVFRWFRGTNRSVLVSSAAGGGAANGASSNARVSSDGRYVAYESDATNLVAGGAPAGGVYVWDAATGDNTLVSEPEGGGVANGRSRAAWISADGSQVVFRSDATNLVPGQGSGLYRWTRASGSLEFLAPPLPGSTWAGSTAWIASPDGRYATVSTLAGSQVTLHVVDLTTTSELGSCELATAGLQGRGDLSEGGRILAGSFWTGPVWSDDYTLGVRWAGYCRIVPLEGYSSSYGNGSQATDISADGRRFAANLPGIRLCDKPDPEAYPCEPHSVARVIASPTSLNYINNLASASAFVHEPVSEWPRPGPQTDGHVALSGTGGSVAYDAWSSEIVDGVSGAQVYVWDSP